MAVLSDQNIYVKVFNKISKYKGHGINKTKRVGSGSKNVQTRTLTRFLAIFLYKKLKTELDIYSEYKENKKTVYVYLKN